MKQLLRTALFIASVLLIIFGAFQYALIIVPELHGDLVEIGVRPTVLGGLVLELYFVGICCFGFALMVSFAAIQSIRGSVPPRLPLAVVALIYIAFGIIGFSRSHNPHYFGSLAVGVLLGAALVIPLNETLKRNQQRDYAKLIVVIGFLLILGWQALILYAAHRFIRLWDALELDSNQQLPWPSQLLFGNEFVRWVIFFINLILLTYFVRQKQIQLLFGMVTFFLMLALTIIMHLSLYMPLYWPTR